MAAIYLTAEDYKLVRKHCCKRLVIEARASELAKGIMGTIDGEQIIVQRSCPWEGSVIAQRSHDVARWSHDAAQRLINKEKSP